jgi:hypothetical protein
LDSFSSLSARKIGGNGLEGCSLPWSTVKGKGFLHIQFKDENNLKKSSLRERGRVPLGTVALY